MNRYIIGSKELVPTGYEAITVNTAIGITAALLTPAAGTYTGKPAVYAILTVETDQVRYCIDGTTPTNAIGHLLGVGDVLEVEGQVALANLLMIKVTNNASVKVTVFHAGHKLS